MKGPARYLLPNMVKNPSVPRTVIAKQLKLLEKSIEQRNPLLLARTRLPQPISDEREAVDSEQEYTESEAADYIANSPFMQDVANPVDIRSQQQISQPSNRAAPVRPVPVSAPHHQPSPAATDSAENTPMFHKTPARFTASRPLPPPPLPKPVSEAAASMTTPAAAAEMNGGEVAAATGPAARTAEAAAVAPRKKQPLGVWRPSDADLGYGLPPPPPKPQQTEPEPRRGNPADKSAAVPSTNRYQYLTLSLLTGKSIPTQRFLKVGRQRFRFRKYFAHLRPCGKILLFLCLKKTEFDVFKGLFEMNLCVVVWRLEICKL